ncbi:M14 family zinc carboxypeptidase [Derxia gummosa]|uniref:M14 family zinc carboxypeptidase n=1 Tax=Derxia gummosa DSM 723 TaxID=1121388 RepID=A0A8B6X9U0_9BURK|nr:M14 family zinc carboxypeptidase [Derxia gummosa]
MPVAHAARPAALPELDELEAIAAAAPAGAGFRLDSAGEIEAGGRRFPLPVVTLGNPDPKMPAVGIFGGVHGLERIGAQVALASLRHVTSRLGWDAALHCVLERLRLVFMPVVNPGGLWLGTRANPAGVDLMRNAPVDAVARVPFLVGGQRISAGLPWYRGPAGAPMQPEAEAVCATVERELLGRPLTISIDCHSGFGLADRIWFPWACSPAPVEHLPELHALDALFGAAHPHHRYVFEPQSRQYLAHGDLWDWLYARALDRPGVFLPLTLEMGSWLWIRKNPRQLFSRRGIFNPLIDHRQARVLRRHLAWLDFLMRAAASHERWLPATEAEREAGRAAAIARWYAPARADGRTARTPARSHE